MAPQGVTGYQWFKFNLYFVLEHFFGYRRIEKVIGKSRNALYKEIDDQLKDSGRGELLQHPVVNGDISVEELSKKYLFNVDVPVVFKGVATEWGSVKKWSYEFFKTRYGDKELSLIDNVGVIDRNSPQAYETMTFSDYITELQAGSPKYLKFSRVMDDDSTLKGDFDRKWLEKFHLPTSFGVQFLMFMGGAKTMTPIHCGFANTVFVQITGRKKWIMWAPNERIFFDPRAERRSYNYTDADPYDLNNPRFPLFKYAKRYEIILEPGDVLWFPSHLWHQVENIDGGVSVAYKFVNLPTSFKSSFTLTTLFFLATRPNIFVDVFFHKAKGKDYIFTKSQAELD